MTDKHSGGGIGRLVVTGGGIGVLNVAGLQPEDFEAAKQPRPLPVSSFVGEVRRTLQAGAYGPALLAALVLPDVFGKVEFPDAKGNGDRYVAWYDTFIEPIVHQDLVFNGKAAWKVRNGMMHETGLRFTDFGYDRIIFLPPGPIKIGEGFMKNMGDSGESAFVLDLSDFIERLMHAAEKWAEANSGDEVKRDYLKTLIQVRPEGLPPHFVGYPAIY